MVKAKSKKEGPVATLTATKNGTQLTLKCMFKPETIEMSFSNYDTDFHKLRVSDKVLEKFLDNLDKKTKRGPRFTPQERHNKMVFFIVSRVKPVEGNCAAMRGLEWEASIRTLLKKVFKEDFDKDFGDLGQDVAEREKVEVEGSADDLDNEEEQAIEA